MSCRLWVVTWCGRHPEDLLAEPGILLSRVCVCLCVQGLVHLGKDNLPKVEETLGGGQRSASATGSTSAKLKSAEDHGCCHTSSPALAWRDLMSFSSRS